MSLIAALKDADILGAVAKDGAQMIDAEIAAKRGLRAAALKAGFKTFKRIKPRIIEEALLHLLPEFAPAVEPHFLAGEANGSLQAYFDLNATVIANDMLKVTDARAHRARHKVMKKVYSALRGQAQRHTEEAVPKLAALIKRHI